MRNVIAIIVSADLERNIFGINQYIKKGDISKVYLVYNKSNGFWGEVSQKMTEEMNKRLKNLIETEKISINPDSFEDSFRTFVNIIKKENESTVFVDISSTTKIAAAAVMSLASIYNIKPYVVIPEEDEYPNKNYLEFMKAKKYRKGISLYEIPIIKNDDFLNDLEKRILFILKEKEGRVGSITKLAKTLNLSDEKKDLMKLKYNIERMRNKDMLVTRRVGREKEVSLTFFGNLVSKEIIANLKLNQR